jgi:hypothetical protein
VLNDVLQSHDTLPEHAHFLDVRLDDFVEHKAHRLKLILFD